MLRAQQKIHWSKMLQFKIEGVTFFYDLRDVKKRTACE